MNAKEILKDKFWIVEDKGARVGTLSLAEDKFLFSGPDGCHYYDSKRALTKTFGKDFVWSNITQVETDTEKEIYGYPTSCIPYNTMYDLQKRLPLFTKSNKSKSLYCAGYYIIKFDKGWVKSFCPKQITVERYETQGPFKTDIEMRQALSKVNAK